jgi:hypothetical protein
MIPPKTLIALFEDTYQGLARLGSGLAGLPYEIPRISRTQDDS